MKRIAKIIRITVTLGTCLALPFILDGCVSAETLVKRTDEKLSPCLHVGMQLEAAEKCTQMADLSFLPLRNRPPGVRVYTNSAPAAWPITYSTVLTELHFSQSGELVSWSSKGSYDGM